MTEITPATAADWPAIWPMFQTIVAAGDTYAWDRETSAEAGARLWLETPQETWIARSGAQVAGSYYIKPNAGGGGAHVCNCGFMVAAEARGQGLARRMYTHAEARARALGYRAMQFNFVVSTNPAVALWQSLGFAIVGTLPRAFDHPAHGLVDAHVMFKWLAD